jgi:wobble nucleotide-excising tRNase
MTEYYLHGLSLTDGQIKKIIDSANKHESVTIRLSRANFTGDHKLPLTRTQINQLSSTKTAAILKMSYAQIKHINDIVSNIRKKYNGGFIPLLALIPIIASALGAAGGLAGGVASAVSASNNAKAAAAAQAELERHNREVESQLKAGSGVISDHVGKIPVIGDLLKPLLQKLGLGINDYNRIIKGGCVKCGKGLYLKPYGSGLYLGPKI